MTRPRSLTYLASAFAALALLAPAAFAGSVSLSFDTAADTAGWSKDRSQPQVFESGTSGGGRVGVLQLGVRESGQQGNRGGSLDDDFYNYHGMTYGLGMEGPAAVSIDMYVDSTWTTGARAGMWTTMSNGNKSYPIIEYVVGGVIDGQEEGSGPFTGFRYWQSGFGWNDSGVSANLDGWNSLSITLDGSQVHFSINGEQFYSVDSLGAHAVNNVILQAHNEGTAGEYDVYYDNFAAAPVPSPTAALGGFALMGLTVLRRRRAA